MNNTRSFIPINALICAREPQREREANGNYLIRILCCVFSWDCFFFSTQFIIFIKFSMWCASDYVCVLWSVVFFRCFALLCSAQKLFPFGNRFRDSYLSHLKHFFSRPTYLRHPNRLRMTIELKCHFRNVFDTKMFESSFGPCGSMAVFFHRCVFLVRVCSAFDRAYSQPKIFKQQECCSRSRNLL